MPWMFTSAPVAIRALRLKKGWSQTTLGDRSSMSREAISRIERGQLGGVTLETVEKVAMALGASVNLRVQWQGEQLDRLIDAAHAGLQESVAEVLSALGWLVRVEVSFNHFGDRGRVDLLAFHPLLRILIVLEIKSALGDLQDTLGRLDVTARLGRVVAREVGWTDIADVVPALVIGDSRAARRAVSAHGALFAQFSLRGRAALAWLRRPADPRPTGVLWFAERHDSRHVADRRARRPLEHRDSRRT